MYGFPCMHLGILCESYLLYLLFSNSCVFEHLYSNVCKIKMRRTRCAYHMFLFVLLLFVALPLSLSLFLSFSLSLFLSPSHLMP